jgi:glycosyltransferase involved in cell wall biosynthesis
MMGKPPLAIFSPLPPSRSGIADYCLEQLQSLSADWDVTVVIDDGVHEPSPAPPDVRVLRRRQWHADALATAPIARLYHCGNNPHHEFVLREALGQPGVVVLHDYVMHHLLRAITAGRGDLDAYRRCLEAERGNDAEELIKYDGLGLLTERILYDVPLNGELLAAAAGVIVHSRASLVKIRDRVPSLPALTVPHHYSPPPVRIGSREEERAALGVAPDRIVIASLGFSRPAKQVPLVIRAIGGLIGDYPHVELLLVGEVPNPEDLLDLARAHGLRDRVSYTGYVSTDDFYRYVAASDVIVNLRYPSAGETSGTLTRALGMGKCAVVFDYESFGEYPDQAVTKIPLDTDSSAGLEAALRRLIESPVEREMIGRAAAAYARTDCHLDRCTAKYTEFLREVSSAARPAARAVGPKSGLNLRSPAWSPAEATSRIERLIGLIDAEHLGRDAVRYARTHARRWAETLATLPTPEPGMAALEIGSYEVILPYLRHDLGFDRVIGTFHDPLHSGPERIDRQMAGRNGKDSYELVRVDVESDRFPFADRSFSLVLACEVIEHLTRDPMFMMSEINRVLAIDGVLVLTTPNMTSARGIAAMLAGYSPYLYANFNRNRSVDRHNIEYSPHQIAAILRAAGFEAIELRTPDCWCERPEPIMDLLQARGDPSALRGDMILAVARKRSEIINRYPPEVYGEGPPVRRMSSWGPGMAL